MLEALWERLALERKRQDLDALPEKFEIVAPLLMLSPRPTRSLRTDQKDKQAQISNQLRAPIELVEYIDTIREGSPLSISRHQWMVEAVMKKMEQEAEKITSLVGEGWENTRK